VRGGWPAILGGRRYRVVATPTHKLEDPASTQEPTPGAAVASDVPEHLTIPRPERARLSREETRARVKAFAAEREEAFVAAVREDKG
jgi:hypothetical protein